MKLSTRSRLLCTVAAPLMLGAGLAVFQPPGGAHATACNPCAAASPCASCNPCNPCAGANPCAAACNPCSPCAAANPCASCNPCNPCAGVNPCAAACNPCNPCAAAASTTDCVVPRLACDPCAPAELTADEARAAYACAGTDMAAAYARSGEPAAGEYAGWSNAATAPYPSATHGGRYVNNYYNAAAAAYAGYESAGPMPPGAVLVKDSFTVDRKGRVAVGPMFAMTKMEAGFAPGALDWEYRMVMPDGTLLGATGGPGSAKVEFCAACHNAAAENDALWFLPEDYRG